MCFPAHPSTGSTHTHKFNTANGGGARFRREVRRTLLAFRNKAYLCIVAINSPTLLDHSILLAKYEAKENAPCSAEMGGGLH